MRNLLVTAILFWAAFSYAQMGRMPGMGGSTPSPANNDPYKFPAATQTSPFDQSPKNAFSNNPKLAPSLQRLLPDGPNIQAVCDGFHKLGDCVSAIHASQNLQIPLVDLKDKMIGKDGKNLEKSIHLLKPEVDAKAEKKRAYKQAEKDIPENI